MKCDRCGYDDRGTGDWAHACGPVKIKKPTCIECELPATWARCTQFAGVHPYCDAHAYGESDFKTNDDYTYWKELTDEGH